MKDKWKTYLNVPNSIIFKSLNFQFHSNYINKFVENENTNMSSVTKKNNCTTDGNISNIKNCIISPS